MYIQDIVEPEGVREVFTRDTDSLKLELEVTWTSWQCTPVRRDSPSREQLYSTTKARHARDQSLEILAEGSQLSWGLEKKVWSSAKGGCTQRVRPWVR